MKQVDFRKKPKVLACPLGHGVPCPPLALMRPFGIITEGITAIAFPQRRRVPPGRCGQRRFPSHSRPFHLAGSPSLCPLTSPEDGRPTPGGAGCPPT